MKEERIDWLCSLSDDEKCKLTHRDFSRSELTEILNDITMSKDLRDFANLLYLEDMNVSQVANKLGISWQTSKHNKSVLNKYLRLYLCSQYKKKQNEIMQNKPLFVKLSA